MTEHFSDLIITEDSVIQVMRMSHESEIINYITRTHKISEDELEEAYDKVRLEFRQNRDDLGITFIQWACAKYNIFSVHASMLSKSVTIYGPHEVTKEIEEVIDTHNALGKINADVYKYLKNYNKNLKEDSFNTGQLIPGIRASMGSIEHISLDESELHMYIFA